MKYIKIQGNLLDVLGEDARLTEKETGLRFTPEYQFLDGDIPTSLGMIVDEEKVQKYFNLQGITILESKENFNQEIDRLHIPTYTIYNEGLMNANLNQKVTSGIINLDEMQPDWTPQQEAEWLFSQGISGIRKSEKPKYI